MTEHAPQINQASNFDSTFERMCDVASIMEAGNAEQALRRLLQLCLLQQDDGYSNLDQLIGAVNDKFGLRLPKYRIQASFDWLLTSHEVECHQEDKRYRLSHKTRTTIQEEVERAESLEERVKQKWWENISPSLDRERLWEALQIYLTKVFWSNSIQTLILLEPSRSSEYSERLSSLLDSSLARVFPPGQQVSQTPSDPDQQIAQASLKNAISNFFVTLRRNSDGGNYLSQLNSGAFNFFSLAVAPDIAEQFRRHLEPIILFFDSNFLFSALDLEDSPLAQEKALLEVVRDYGLPFELRYHDAALEEMQVTVKHFGEILRAHQPWTPAMSESAVQHSSGLVRRYHQSNALSEIPVDAFLNPYEHLQLLLESTGVRPYQMEASVKSPGKPAYLSSEYRNFLKKRGRERSAKIVESDMAILNCVSQINETARLEGPYEMRAVLITCDVLLYKFAREQSRGRRALAAAVLPGQFLRALQPFLSRDADLEGAFEKTFVTPGFRTNDDNADQAFRRRSEIINSYAPFPDKESAAKLLANSLLATCLQESKDDGQPFMAGEDVILMEEVAITGAERAGRSVMAGEPGPQELSAAPPLTKETRRLDSEIEGNRQGTQDLEAALRKAERAAHNFVGVCTVLLIGLMICAFENTIYLSNATWIVKSPHVVGLQILFILVLIILSIYSIGSFYERWRKRLWKEAVVLTILAVLVAIVVGITVLL